jgi:hypothetical protein
MDEVIWFCLIKFTHQTEEYMMLTNTVQDGDVEIPQSYTEEVIDECQFDGPESWAEDMQNLINKELDYFILEIFDYTTPCYYAADINVIKPRYRGLIKRFNKAYEQVN